MGSIKIEKMNKSYDGKVSIFNDFDLEIPDESFTVILGPSGCGKSTLLRIISGLESFDKGNMSISNKDVSNVPPKDRNLAMVFQNYALYPHMSSYKNIEYALKIRKINKEKRKELVNRALKIVDLADHADKRPSQLSGGQQQRVALARAIVKEPEVFLMDEPLSNLDAKLRNQMRETISSLHERLKTTFVFVTHDQAEAMSLADNIILLNNGKIMQQGSPQNLYTDPNNIFVARFIGSPPTNIWHDNDVFYGVKPEAVYLEPDENLDYLVVQSELEDVDPQGSDIIYRVKTDLGIFHIKAANNWSKDLEINTIYIPKSAIMVFGSDEERIRDTTLIETYINKL